MRTALAPATLDLPPGAPDADAAAPVRVAQLVGHVGEGDDVVQLGVHGQHRARKGWGLTSGGWSELTGGTPYP